MRACNSCGNLVEDFESCDFCIEWRLEYDKRIKKLEKKLEIAVSAMKWAIETYRGKETRADGLEEALSKIESVE